MKKFPLKTALILVYIVTILFISGMAKATTLNDNTVVDESSITFDGLVVPYSDGNFAIVNNNKKFYNIKSSIDLSQFAGEMVHVSGYEYLNQLGPVLEVDSQDPLIEISKKNGPTMFVMSISPLSL